MSTDFLLGETNIPYRTNYDIEALGLSAKAAQRLYTGEVDPVAVSQLIKALEPEIHDGRRLPNVRKRI